jgi:gamma-glutamyltranspeptidase/glutathione hydrolase
VADEPQAAIVGKRVLSAGGNAADAAAAMGFALSVTLPSRASLGAGGACLAYDPSRTGPGLGLPEALLFDLLAPANPGRADRPASAPMLARGMLALQARYGVLPAAAVISPAEQLARFGMSVSRAFRSDLLVVAGPLAADPAARAIFFQGGQMPAEGAQMLQSELASTLSQLRVLGVGDLYQGSLARALEASMGSAGGGLAMSDLRGAVPKFAPAWIEAGPREDQIALLPATERGAAPVVAALLALSGNLQDTATAQSRALAVAAAARQGDPANEKLARADLPAATPGPLPASTTFAVLDRNGGAVICGLSMGNLFGTGRVAPGTGILLGVSPARTPAPLLSMAMQVNRSNKAFHAMAAGSGQEAAPISAALGLFAGANGQLPAQTPEPGRVTAVACTEYLPGSDKSCRWSTDPRGFGFAAARE